MGHQNISEAVYLAIDTSSSTGSIALARIQDQKIKAIFDVAWKKNATHSEMATLGLQELLKKSNCTLHDLTHILVNVGPGSFTGIRVGITLATTLAYTLDLPIAAIPRFASLAINLNQNDQPTSFALKAVQDFYYFATVERNHGGLKLLNQPISVRESELQSAAHGTTLLVEGQNSEFTAETHAQSLIQVCLDHGPEYRFLSWEQVRPLYIRGSEAEEKLKRGVLKPLN